MVERMGERMPEIANAERRRKKRFDVDGIIVSVRRKGRLAHLIELHKISTDMVLDSSSMNRWEKTRWFIFPSDRPTRKSITSLALSITVSARKQVTAVVSNFERTHPCSKIDVKLKSF